MSVWKVEPVYKKSIVEISFWVKDDKRIRYEIGWRGGEFEIETPGDEPPEIDDSTDMLCDDQFEMLDWSSFDGCWDDYSFYGCTEEEEEEIRNFLEDGNSIFDLEEQGWYCEDTEVYITDGVKIEKVE